MNIFAIGACAVCAVVFGAFLKKGNREVALLLTLAAVTLILLSVMEQLGPLVEQLKSLSSASVVGDEAISVVLKAVGMAVVGQFASGFCKDAGESALAEAVNLASRAAILLCAMPLIVAIFQCVEEVLAL